MSSASSLPDQVNPDSEIKVVNPMNICFQKKYNVHVYAHRLAFDEAIIVILSLLSFIGIRKIKRTIETKRSREK